MVRHVRHPDPETETSCRHCGLVIRKRRDKSGNGFEWVSYRGWDPKLKAHVYSRFCPVPGTLQRMKPKRQHAPIPIDNPKKLGRWLDS